MILDLFGLVLLVKEAPVRILGREVRKLCYKKIPMVKIQCNRHDENESSWELESELRKKYPHLFIEQMEQGT